ncbi:LuxR family transcriptional regulator [Pseudomonas syringae]|uniref:LuxR family transcriptional regulator n=1 Tax=Pseudomonas syringae TaxID=317 RepID=A0A085V515_PSESX|nr:LuxR family transcriptional regulator [Pseudomonas syringae]
MNLQPVSVIDPHFDIASARDLVAAKYSPPQARHASLRLTMHGEQQIQRPGGLLLTGRECRILQEISVGANNKQVARLLEISPSTVRTHLESIFRKLECSTRAAATFKAAKLGLIS